MACRNIISVAQCLKFAGKITVKLSLCFLAPSHDTWEGGGIAPWILNLGSRGPRHDSFIPTTCWIGGCVGTFVCLDWVAKRTSVLMPGIKSQSSSPKSSHKGD